MGITFPNESSEYREARNALLKREVALRREMESVAKDVRALPPGGEVREDYVFDAPDADIATPISSRSGGNHEVSVPGLQR